MLRTHRDKGPHHLCACVFVYVCVCVYMHVCVFVNMESTAYRIHLALPNANNLQRESNTPFVCLCVRVCTCVYMHVCVLSTWSLPPIVST